MNANICDRIVLGRYRGTRPTNTTSSRCRETEVARVTPRAKLSSRSQRRRQKELDVSSSVHSARGGGSIHMLTSNSFPVNLRKRKRDDDRSVTLEYPGTNDPSHPLLGPRISKEEFLATLGLYTKDYIENYKRQKRPVKTYCIRTRLSKG